MESRISSGVEKTSLQDKILVKIDYLPSVNYAMMNNGVEVCNSLVLENDDDREWQQLSLTISGQYIKESGCGLEFL